MIGSWEMTEWHPKQHELCAKPWWHLEVIDQSRGSDRQRHNRPEDGRFGQGGENFDIIIPEANEN
jgi:hypothetical protein